MTYKGGNFFENYSIMSDDDLMRLSMDQGSLVPEALHALQNEIERRRLVAPDGRAQSHIAAEPPATKPRKGRGWLIFAVVFACAATFKGFLSGYLDREERSHRINAILQEARSNEAVDNEVRASFQEVVSRRTSSFDEFARQCKDLQAVQVESDALEEKKRGMLIELQHEFRGDLKVQPIFSTLHELENLSDKEAPIWGEMIACSDRLAASDRAAQAQYEATCVEPANRQLEPLRLELGRLVAQLQSEVQQSGGSLPPEVLQTLQQ